MNKKSVINKVYVKSPFGKEESINIFNRTIELLKESIRDEKKIKLKGFGKFTIERREAKTVTDYKRKAEVLLPPKDKITFKPSKKLVKRINEEE